jgi:hypothetical protein
MGRGRTIPMAEDNSPKELLKKIKALEKEAASICQGRDYHCR